MKNLFKNSKSELDLTNVAEILAAGAAAGMAISTFAGKKGNVGGIIGAGFSLLIGGLIIAMDEDSSKKKSDN